MAKDSYLSPRMGMLLKRARQYGVNGYMIDRDEKKTAQALVQRELIALKPGGYRMTYCITKSGRIAAGLL